jgi:hypothetical protein
MRNQNAAMGAKVQQSLQNGRIFYGQKQKHNHQSQANLSAIEQKLKKTYSRLPFSFSEDWDPRLEPPV